MGDMKKLKMTLKRTRSGKRTRSVKRTRTRKRKRHLVIRSFERLRSFNQNKYSVFSSTIFTYMIIYLYKFHAQFICSGSTKIKICSLIFYAGSCTNEINSQRYFGLYKVDDFCTVK